MATVILLKYHSLLCGLGEEDVYIILPPESFVHGISFFRTVYFHVEDVIFWCCDFQCLIVIGCQPRLRRHVPQSQNRLVQI